MPAHRPSLHPLPLALAVGLAVLPVRSAAGASLEIWQVQGRTASSPVVGERVGIAASVVTAVGSQGFFIQTPPERTDGDPATSDGLYVYTGAAPGVRQGDLVELVGTVAEYYGLTELGGAPSVAVLGSGVGLPVPVRFDGAVPGPSPLVGADILERYEGMLVEITGGMVCGPSDRYGVASAVAVGARPFREPGIVFPGLDGLPMWDGNPEVVQIEAGGLAGQAVALSSPAGLHAVGPLTFGFGRYRLWPFLLDTTEAGLPRPVRARRAGELTVATQNLLGLFDSSDDPGSSDTVLTPQDTATKLRKLSRWIRENLGAPDIVAVQEAENQGILVALADRIRNDDPNVVYTALLEDGNDLSGIDVGFLVRDTVRVTGAQQVDSDLSFSWDGSSYPVFDRPPLLLRAEVTTAGAPYQLVVVNLHLRSLIGIDGDNGGFVRAKRFAQALAVATLVQNLQHESPAVRLLVTGDFNAYEFSDGFVDVVGTISGHPDPAGALLASPAIVDPPLAEAMATLGAAERYSYVHDGNAQAIDHILLSRAVLPWLRGSAFARGNADAPELLAADADTALRCSDHDGLVVFLAGDADGDGVPDDYRPRPPRPRLPR